MRYLQTFSTRQTTEIELDDLKRLLAACVQLPLPPTVPVLPVYDNDSVECIEWDDDGAETLRPAKWAVK